MLSSLRHRSAAAAKRRHQHQKQASTNSAAAAWRKKAAGQASISSGEISKHAMAAWRKQRKIAAWREKPSGGGKEKNRKAWRCSETQRAGISAKASSMAKINK